jgi:hypothetical protein
MLSRIKICIAYQNRQKFFGWCKNADDGEKRIEQIRLSGTGFFYGLCFCVVRKFTAFCVQGGGAKLLGMSKEVDKSGQSCGTKLRIEDGGTDLFKRCFYMNVAIMCRALRQKLLGHYLYHGMSGNTRGIKSYYYHTVRLAFKWINRRSQKKSYNWTHNIYGSVTVGTTTLAPGESTLGTVTHEVTEEDIPPIINIATVNATDPLGDSVTDDDDCTINVTHISLPAWWKGSEEGER